MSGSALDLSSSDKKLWLVKFPPMVAQRLHALAAQGADNSDAAGNPVGRVRVTQNATQTSSEFRLELDAACFPTLPKEFNMRPHPDGVQCAYSFTQQGGNIGVEGQIDQRFDVEMRRAAEGKLDPQYRSLARDRSQAAGRKTRVMQVIDDPRNLLLRPMPVGYTKRKAEKATDNKRLRMERDALENVLFGLFEKQSTWGFGQLQRETDQPAPWLKEVLNGVALLNKTGPNRDKWQVKPEYRGQHKDS